jgi:hypothetical protein
VGPATNTAVARTAKEFITFHSQRLADAQRRSDALAARMRASRAAAERLPSGATGRSRSSGADLVDFADTLDFAEPGVFAGEGAAGDPRRNRSAAELVDGRALPFSDVAGEAARATDEIKRIRIARVRNTLETDGQMK